MCEKKIPLERTKISIIFNNSKFPESRKINMQEKRNTIIFNVETLMRRQKP